MRRLRTHFGLILALTALLTSTILAETGCAPPAAVAGRSTANLTTPGIRALQAKEGIKYLDLIRDFAQDGEAAKVVPLETAVKVTRWHKALVLTINQTPNGWAAVALTGLDALQQALSPTERALLDPYISSARIIYQAVTT